MRQLLREGFDKRVLLPVLAAIALVISGFFVAEARRSYTRELTQVILERQDRMRELAELIYICIESESAQRGYLLTGETKYVEPYDQGRSLATARMDSLLRSFSRRNPEELDVLHAAESGISANFTNMDETLRMMREGLPRQALAAVKTDVVLYQMREIRDELEALRTRERARIYDSLTQWNSELRLNSLINLASTAFTLGLLVLVGLLATREVRR